MDDFYEFLGFKEIMEKEQNKVKESLAELEKQSDNVANDLFPKLINPNQENS